MCDDCLSASAAVKPRQTVNINCRELENAGSLRRQKNFCPRCRKIKIINRIHDEQLQVPRKSKIIRPKPTSKGNIEPVVFSEGEFSSDMMKRVIGSFAERIGRGEIEIYNEFSLQHELGIYLRNAIAGKQVQFERNVSFLVLLKNISRSVKSILLCTGREKRCWMRP